jgi:hypothetical protein
VGDIQEKLFPYPLTPLLKPLGMARRAESAAATGEVEEKFRTTVRTANPDKPAAWVAAVQIFFDHLFDDGSEEAVLPLESALILGQELIEVVEQHPVEDSPLGMSRTVKSCHSRSFSSRNRPDRTQPTLCPYMLCLSWRTK